MLQNASYADLIVIAIVAATVMVLMMSLPVKALTFLLGVLLPVWALPGVPPWALDASRGGLAVAIAARSIQRAQQRPPTWLSVCLLAVAGLVTTAAVASSDKDQATLGATMATSVALSWLVARSLDDDSRRLLLQGFMVGLSASATVLLSAALGGPDLQPQSQTGLLRATGLGPAAPLVSYEFAAGVAAVLYLSRHRKLPILYLAMTGLFVAALLMSGGRGGVAALGSLALVGLYQRFIRPSVLFATVATISGLIWLTQRLDLGVNFLLRLDAAQDQVDVSGGRRELLTDALASVVEMPLFGVGLSNFASEHGVNPHIVPLNFAVMAGVVPGLILAIVLVRLLVDALRRGPHGNQTFAIYIGPVLLVWSVLEPVGPFVGLEGLLLLTLGMARYRDIRKDSPAPPPRQGVA